MSLKDAASDPDRVPKVQNLQPNPKRVGWQVIGREFTYLRLAGGTMPHMRRYSTIWP
jgi:hypothetical protein